MEPATFFSKVRDIITSPLFTLKETPVTLASVFILIIFLWAVMLVSRFIRRVMARWLEARTSMARETRYTLTRVTQYAVIIIGVIVAFQFVGINLSGLAVIFGLLSVGIGFGLQNLTSNFVSGLILLVERPIKVGDRVTVGDTEGDVEEINMRSTTIHSLNNISIIVPNSEFISNTVINWSHGDPKVRLNLDVGVSYQSDVDTVLRCLGEAAREHPDVLEHPAPEVYLTEFGDSAWNMRLWFWIPRAQITRRVKSEVNIAIVKKFRDNNVEIPFPQRDLHLRSPLPLPLEPQGALGN
jgi:small-conductance mechanosensitive channel